MSSSVTFLPIRLKRAWRSDKNEAQLAPKAADRSLVQEKLVALRSKHAAKFFRAKARQRVGAQALASAVSSTTTAVMTVLRSLRRIVTGFFNRKHGLASLLDPRSKWRNRLKLLSSMLTGSRSLLTMAQTTLSRAFASFHIGKSERVALAERERQQRHTRIYQWVCRSLARLGRSAIAAARRRYKIESAAKLSREMVGKLVDEQITQVAALRELEWLEGKANVIQRFWRRVQRNERAGFDVKARLVNLLMDMDSCIERHVLAQRQTLNFVHQVSVQSTAVFVRRAAQRVGARLIQRVWRGHCGRERVRRLREWKMKRFLRRRQCGRLRDARGALLVPSEKDKRLQKELETRMLARQQNAPVLPLLRRGDHRLRMRGERVTLLEPLPLQSQPPRISSLTRTKIQCVPFSRFEKMISQEARVNLSNVWVAIPVAHQDVDQIPKHTPKHYELSPLLVGKGRKR